MEEDKLCRRIGWFNDRIVESWDGRTIGWQNSSMVEQ